MENQTTNTAQNSTASGSRKNHLWVFALCLVMGVSLAVSMALLGGSLGRVLEAETNVIDLIPRETVNLETANPESGSTVYYTPLAVSGGASARTTGSTDATQPTIEYKGKLDIFDDEKAWGSETQVDLFRNSYDGTVASRDGEKVIAPGTSNYYDFALKNNGNIPLDYTISLEVETLGQPEAAPAIPMEWRLLDGGGAAVSGWKEYGSEEKLKQSSLNARRQDSYSIEWRWNFQQGKDQADTELGDLAEKGLLGVKATIKVFAEQSPNWKDRPTGGWWLPKTGDPFNLTLWLAVLVVSGCGLVILVVLVRRKKKDKDEKHGGRKR